jgi:hypothetical protein
VAGRAGFVDALVASPLGVTLMAVLEAGHDRDAGWTSSSTRTSPAGVAAAVDAVESMRFGVFVDAALYAAVVHAGPWIGDAPDTVANAYRHAEARAPIAEAIAGRVGDIVHAPVDLDGQQWWMVGSAWLESRAPLFRQFDLVYGAGQFTIDGLWTVSDPPEEAYEGLAGSWEYETGPVRRVSLPVRSTARVFEIDRPEDWARLVSEHPREGAPHPEWELPGVNQRVGTLSSLLSVPNQRAARASIGRHLVPDWRSVAERYDGVHLSWAGFITSEGCITDVGGDSVTMLRYWFSERTLWLADVFGEPGLLPDPAVDLSHRNREGSPPTVKGVRETLDHLLGR